MSKLEVSTGEVKKWTVTIDKAGVTAGVLCLGETEIPVEVLGDGPCFDLCATIDVDALELKPGSVHGAQWKVTAGDETCVILKDCVLSVCDDPLSLAKALTNEEILAALKANFEIQCSTTDDGVVLKWLLNGEQCGDPCTIPALNRMCTLSSKRCELDGEPVTVFTAVTHDINGTFDPAVDVQHAAFTAAGTAVPGFEDAPISCCGGTAQVCVPYTPPVLSSNGLSRFCYEGTLYYTMAGFASAVGGTLDEDGGQICFPEGATGLPSQYTFDEPTYTDVPWRQDGVDLAIGDTPTMPVVFQGTTYTAFLDLLSAALAFYDSQHPECEIDDPDAQFLRFCGCAGCTPPAFIPLTAPGSTPCTMSIDSQHIYLGPDGENTGTDGVFCPGQIQGGGPNGGGAQNWIGQPEFNGYQTGNPSFGGEAAFTTRLTISGDCDGTEELCFDLDGGQAFVIVHDSAGNSIPPTSGANIQTGLPGQGTAPCDDTEVHLTTGPICWSVDDLGGPGTYDLSLLFFESQGQYDNPQVTFP